MKKRKSRKPKKEEIAEDYCFVCKDGGDLAICEYRNCLKAYHAHCIGKDDSFLDSEEKLLCNWHYCLACKKASEFQCYFCPKGVCIRCIYDSEFVNFKGKYGFCRICLKVVLLLEEGKDVDSDGEKVDFNDYETVEAHFKVYYNINKEKECFNLDDLRVAKDRLKAGKNLLTHSDSGEFDDTEEESLGSECDIIDDNIDPKPKLKKPKISRKHATTKSKGLEFCGWGSKPLIKFLKEMGRETEQKISHFDVTSLINRYINDKYLYLPNTKKKILCDDKLSSIFGKKILKINKIHDLLGAHFSENVELSSEEEHYSEDDDSVQICSLRRESKSYKSNPKKEAPITVPVGTRASVSKHNIDFVYLRRSLVQELSKHPESFESKIIGSFVRVKTDPNDFWQKNSHQLVQVSGVKRVSTTSDKSEINLNVTNMLNEISISLLSEGDFSEEEVEDLLQRMKSGVIQPPTVVELQKKANLLHQDITMDWIGRELKKLDTQIDHANEKGWRKEYFEYLEKRKRLQSRSIQSQYLETYPTVIPEIIEAETVLCEEEGSGNGGDYNEASPELNDISLDNHTSGVETKTMYPDPPTTSMNRNEPSDDAKPEESHKQEPPSVKPVIELNDSDTENDEDPEHVIPAVKVALKSDKDPEHVIPIVKVALKSDEDPEHVIPTVKVAPESDERKVWMILSPNGTRKGPFQLSALKRLVSVSSYARNVMKAWKENQNEEDAMPLGEVVNLAFPATSTS